MMISELPDELLLNIVEKLNSAEDFVRFAATCPSRQVSPVPKPLPWLLLPDNTHDTNGRFFSLSDQKTYTFELPEARRCRCWGSQLGWLITFNKDEQSLHLLNPLSRSHLRLPPLSDHEPQLYISKALLFLQPHSSWDQFIVFAVHSTQKQLSFARSKDPGWTALDMVWQEDILHVNGQVYTVDILGQVGVFDITTPAPTAMPLAQAPGWCSGHKKYYLVELEGKMHLVVRTSQRRTKETLQYLKTEMFEVFKWDSCQSNWEELQTLGNYALFIGEYNTPISVKASEYPTCKPGCIYFTDDDYLSTEEFDHKFFRWSKVREEFYNNYGLGMETYNLETKVFESFYAPSDEALFRISSPLWITPKLT